MSDMKKRSLLFSVLLACTSTLTSVPSHAGPFTTGNLIVVRLGDGQAALASTGAAVFIDEYTTAGTLVQSIAVPTDTTPTSHALIMSGTATSEGDISNSPNLKYAAFAGYERTLGTVTGSIASTHSDTLPRVVAILAADGSINLNSAFNDYANGNNPRSAFCNSTGDSIWMAGGTGGVRLSPVFAVSGVDTSTLIGTNSTGNMRFLRAFDGQLYISGSSGTPKGLMTIGTGIPTAINQTIANLPGAAPTSGSPYSYFMADIDANTPGYDVLYVADDGSPAITKYSLIAGLWVNMGTVGTTSDNFTGMVGSASDTTVTLYVTADGTDLETLTDTTGINGTLTATPTSIATAGVNMAFRGVAWAPLQAPLSLKLISFNAGPRDNAVKVWWATSNESGVKSFTIERSTDGKDFSGIGSVAASNNSTYSYSFDDLDPIAGVAYYRLKVNELNGSNSYSSVVKVETKQNNVVSVSPNPVTGTIVISHGAAGDNASVSISSLDGKTLFNIPAVAGSTNSSFNIAGLTPGVYLAVYNNNGEKTTVKFVKQ